MKQGIKNAGGVLGLMLGMALAGTLSADDAAPVPSDPAAADRQAHASSSPPENHVTQTQPSTTSGSGGGGNGTGDITHPWLDRVETRRKMHDGGGGPSGPFATLSPQQIDDALAILREVRPDRAQQLEAMRKTNPEHVVDVLREAMPRLIELGFLRRHDPELFKIRVEDYRLEHTTQELARQVRQADEAKDEGKSKSLRTQLQAKLEEHFALRQKAREHELAKLEKQLAEMHAKIDATKKSKEELIKQRMDELIGEPNRPEW